MKVQIGDSLVTVGSIIFATQDRVGAKWHLTGELVGLGEFRIDRIWRGEDDAETFSLAWETHETYRHRVVTDVKLGLPGDSRRRPEDGPDSPTLRVVNQKNFYHYDKEEESEIKAERPKMQTGDLLLSKLIEEWVVVREKIDVTGLDDEVYADLGESLDALENQIIDTKATTNRGALWKLQIVEYYVKVDIKEAVGMPDIVLKIVQSVMSDVK